jgi:hypothetical protein
MVRRGLLVLRFLPNEAVRGAPPPEWFHTLLQRILDHNQAVLALLGPLPEPFRTRPPQHVRALLYDYRFTHQREQDSKQLTEKTPADQIGRTWYRNFVNFYDKVSRKTD